MKALLYWIVGWITKIHNYIMRFNDAYEYDFTDKELHFLVIGVLGMGFIFVIYPVFKWLADRGHIMTITFIYAFTLIVVITFAIEIGQKVTNTGNMEFADIMMGVLGFVLMYAVFATVRQICKAIYRLFKPSEERKSEAKSLEKRISLGKTRRVARYEDEDEELAQLEDMLDIEILDDED